jgi:Spx/MgsR family transcriptional regulator
VHIVENAKIYGLDKCSTCQKARTWLDRHKVAYEFSDYREHRVDALTLKAWAKAVGGWEKLVNRTGMTWRNLPPARKSPASDPEWLLLIKEYPALVRRPVVVQADGSVSLGFTDKLFARLFAART